MGYIDVPPAADDQVRRARDLERRQQEQAAARSLEASQIGGGGLVVSDGGSITIEDGGDLYVDGDATFNGNLTVPDGTLNTAGNIEAGGTLQGGAVVSTGNASVAGTLTAGAVSTGGVSAASAYTSGHGQFDAGVRSVGAYNENLSGGGAYSEQYIHSDGRMGYVPSSARFKQNIETWEFDPAIISYLRVVTFRYILAVENLGDDAEEELGLIAEEVHALGLRWLVDYKPQYTEEGAQAVPPYQGEVVLVPFGVKYSRITLALIRWNQLLQEQTNALLSDVAALKQRLGDAGI